MKKDSEQYLNSSYLDENIRYQSENHYLKKSNDGSQQSLFMKYVKSKIVKKIQDEHLPTQIASKYLDIYQKLVQREQ